MVEDGNQTALNPAFFSSWFDSVQLLRKSANTRKASVWEQNVIVFQIRS